MADAEVAAPAVQDATTPGRGVSGEESARELVVAAGILPLMVDPEHGCVYCLLGRGRMVPQWAAGSVRWGVFAGRRKAQEAPTVCAAREFVEETAGMVRFWATDETPRRTWLDIAASLHDGHVLCTITSAHGGDSPEAPAAGVVLTYVVLLPWQPEAPRQFHHVRGLLQAMRKQMMGRPLSDEEHGQLHPSDWTTRKHRAAFLLSHPAVSWSRVRLRPAVAARLDPSGPGGPSGTRDGISGRGSGGNGGSDDSLVGVAVVKDVKVDWLDMTELELFSLVDVRHAVANGGSLSNGRGRGTETLHPSQLTIVTALCRELVDMFPWLAFL